MSLNLSQFKHNVVTPALTLLGASLSTTAAINLVTGTALQESELVYLAQLNGPALGLCQMEPATEQDIITNFFPYNPIIYAAIQSILAPGTTTPQLAWNLYYSVMMCRIKYYRAPSGLPAYNDPTGLGTYWKTVYNTSLGAGTVDAATVANFQSAINA